MRITVARSFMGFGLFLLVGLVAAVGVGLYSLQQLRIGGQQYHRIADSKDLMGDLISPPLFIVEAYLEARLAMANPYDLDIRKQRLAQLHKSYDARRQYWRDSSIPESLKEGLDVSSALADQFWTELDGHFMVLLDKGQIRPAEAALQTLSEIFEKHRAEADKLIQATGAWGQSVETDSDRLAALMTKLLFGTNILIAIAVALAIALVLRHVCRPIEELAHCMSSLADGATDTSVPHAERRDEIGLMAKAVLVFRDAGVKKLELEAEAKAMAEQGAEERRRAQEEAIAGERALVVRSIGAALQELARKNLAFRMTEALPEAYEDLKINLNATIAQVEAAIGHVSDVSQAIGNSTDQISTANDDLSRRTEAQAASLEETAAALEEITVTVSQTAEGARHAETAVADINTDATRTSEVLRNAMSAMAQIEQSSSRISTIIGVIDEIAFQTNLLALNAGVEAARAGEAGRGFAVVASEVRALAQRCTAAAKEIKGLISNSVTEVAHGVDLVGQTGDALDRIIRRFREVTEIVVQIAHNAREQASGLREVNTAVAEIDRMTQENAAMVAETTAASHSLRQEMSGLLDAVAEFTAARHEEALPERPEAVRVWGSAAEPIRLTRRKAAVG